MPEKARIPTKYEAVFFIEGMVSYRKGKSLDDIPDYYGDAGRFAWLAGWQAEAGKLARLGSAACDAPDCP